MLRGHQLSDFGTFGSLLATGDTQTILSSPSAGANRTGYTCIATLMQNLWSEAALVELAYHLHLADSLALTPLLQIIADPAENPRGDLFVLAGLRAVCAF